MRSSARVSALSLTAVFALVWPAAAGAQENRQQKVPDAVSAKPDSPRQARDEPKGPGLGGEQFVRQETEQMADAKWNEAFDLLKKLIKATPDSDPAKPELLFRMSEMYWEKANTVNLKGFDEEANCLKASGGDRGREAACVAQRKKMEDASQGYRDDAIKVYKHLVKNFPGYPRLDEVLFALGFNYQRKSDPESAKKIFGELIRRYPQSPRIPATLLQIGEIFFEDGQVESALKAYSKVVTNYRDSDVYGYSLYKLGWCYFNMGQFNEALRRFIDAAEYAKKQKGQKKNRVILYREALRDAVRTYVHIDRASPLKAIGFFRGVAPDEYLDLSERLAELYGDTGQFEKSNTLYRELIKLNPESYKVVSYQLQIAFNTRNIGKQIESVKELSRLVSLWRSAKDAKDADPARVAKDRQGIEEQLRSMAVNYHRQALQTKNDDDYALAYNLYAEYVKTFPEGQHSYDMTFYLGELTYTLRKWKEAAVNYERTLELNPSGEFTKDAAHGAVLAYKKLLGTDNRERPDSKGSAENDDVLREVPKPEPIPEDYQLFLAACDRYTKYVTESEFLVDIKYDKARTYYDFNHFDDAIAGFKDISEKHTNHRLSIFAANLLLDTYNLRQDFKALDQQVDTFLGIYTRDRDPEFYELLVRLKQQSKFKECRLIEGEKKWAEAASCYSGYARRFPNSPDLDKVLYNAALNYERDKRIEQAIQVRLHLVNSVEQESDLKRKALYQIAGNLHALAIYSEASKAYEFYAENYSDTEEAKDALRNAAVFREGLGEDDLAVKNYMAYLKLIGSDRQKAAEVFFSLGRIYEKQEQHDKVISHYQQFLKTYGNVASTDLILEAHTRTGNAHMAKKRPDERAAQKAYQTSYEAFLKLDAGQREGLTTGRSAVAEARFKMGEAIFREFEATKLKVNPFKNVKKFLEVMGEQIKTRTKLIVDASVIYNEVIKFGSANWGIAALARIGQMYQALANDIYDAPAPGSFDEEQVEVYKGTMAERAQIPEGKAVEAYVLCREKAKELRWFNVWSDLCGRQLARIKPSEFRFDAEMRARPPIFAEGRVSKAVILRLPSEVTGEDN